MNECVRTKYMDTNFVVLCTKDNCFNELKYSLTKVILKVKNYYFNSKSPSFFLLRKILS